ncbi:MAG: hypothetical protein JWR26_656 [Pedosphaera sp.]|nr:hypothetical protein [Pedosphaera sp.]
MEAPPVIAATRFRRPPLWILIGAVVATAGIAVLFLFNPSTHGFYPRCALYTSTGIYCPGCGALRSLHHLAHGHLLTALHYNSLLVLSLPFLAYMGVRLTLREIAGNPLPSITIHPRWIKLFIGVLILFTILRNIHLPPFNYLAPP